MRCQVGCDLSKQARFSDVFSLLDLTLVKQRIYRLIHPFGGIVKRRDFLALGTAAALVHLSSPTLYAQSPATGASGSAARRRLVCHWEARKKGKYVCDLSATNTGPFHFTQMYVNGVLQVRARFPNVDASGASQYVSGIRILPKTFIRPDFGDSVGDNVTGIEFDPATFTQKRWGDPEVSIVYLHGDNGDVPLPLLSIDYDRNILWCVPPAGGLNLAAGSVPRFYVDNVYEEMNARQEWFLFPASGNLYYLPPPEIDMATAIIEIPA
jgi:hypothetical protein